MYIYGVLILILNLITEFKKYIMVEPLHLTKTTSTIKHEKLMAECAELKRKQEERKEK